MWLYHAMRLQHACAPPPCACAGSSAGTRLSSWGGDGRERNTDDGEAPPAPNSAAPRSAASSSMMPSIVAPSNVVPSSVAPSSMAPVEAVRRTALREVLAHLLGQDGPALDHYVLSPQVMTAVAAHISRRIV